MKKIFLNLTNGIEAIEKYNLNIEDMNFIRIQSTHCEHPDFERILFELDHNFLMWLALGYECVVYDFGAKSKTSKAVYHGLEWVKYVLNRRWFNLEITPFVRSKNVTSSFERYYYQLSRTIKRKIDYYKKFLLIDKLRLSAVTTATNNDNKPDYYLNILNKYYLK